MLPDAGKHCGLLPHRALTQPGLERPGIDALRQVALLGPALP
jgi:hypothetical protein